MMMGIPLEVVPALNDTAPMSSPNPSSLTAVDGKKLGTALKTKVASESLEQRVTRVVGKSKDLKLLLPHLFPHLESMLIHILQNKIVDMGETRQRARAVV